ncbi:hypothetical protein AALP_AA8G086900 [Arabis alpina]|uniref:Uncharacterized protein n=1 Tax=Arabis alpina TaxID=50452 RepID=A0A087G5U5_ARAAL|nr:hypothetical protein AALP_AA8G086900 [Arabis alpina]
MGGCFSVSLSCDQVINQCSQCLCVKVGYIHSLSKNLASLQKAMRDLKAKRDDVQGRVDREEFTGRHRRLSQIQVWLTSILTIENQFSDLHSTSKIELQRLCLCGVCSKDLKLSYRYGKRVILMLREIKSLSSQGQFDVVTEEVPRVELEELPIQPTIVGQETLLEKVWNRLMEDRVGIVGLYGMGGVGKTTLLTQINNKFSEIGGRFDVVIWIVLSKNATVHKIQGSIAKKLGLGGKEWDEKNENERALDIYNVLRRKKFVLMLDDIWEKVNLNVIGVPYPNRENKCKVAFTTRSRDVCGRMGVDDPIQVCCLNADKAWDLFKKKVGKNTLGSHPDIPDLARKVAEKCRGLPLALNVIGETMACKTTIQEWLGAIDVLTSSATDFSGMEDEILPILKYSYDSLNGEQVKTCFLYCSLFPEDCLIDKKGLVDYCVGEGVIDEKEGRKRAINQGYEILGTLVRACLLLEQEENKSKVKMHDVVREMALWIASDLGKHKDRCIVQAGVGLREIPKVGNWKNAKRMSLMANEIEKIYESPDCPELTTLLLQKNSYLATISGEFFRSMSRLLLLDLSRNKCLYGLPEQISGLVSLRYLDLSHTSIKRLPVGLQELKMLIHLNLEWTESLESLDGISNLLSLRTLKLVCSKVWLDMSLMKKLELLEHLEFININTSSSFVGKLLVYDPKVWRSIQHLSIQERPEETVRILVLPAMDNLCKIWISECGTREIKIEKSLASPCFSNLSVVEIGGCDALKDLTWLMLAPNLTHLYLMGLKQVEEIISKEKATSVVDKETCNIIPFQKLEALHLVYLPELKSIYWNALPFQRLRRLYIHEYCPKLRKLPLDSKSVIKVEEFVIECEKEEWIQGIEWEDEATRNRFVPSCRKI